jgi:hypothetical protein
MRGHANLNIVRTMGPSRISFRDAVLATVSSRRRDTGQHLPLPIAMIIASFVVRTSARRHLQMQREAPFGASRKHIS